MTDILCAGCNRKIGDKKIIGGLEFLSVNGLLLRSAHGACLECHKEFHYTMNDAMLSRILVRIEREQLKLMV